MATQFAVPKISAAVWLVLRLWLGYIWLQSGWNKILGEKASAWVGSKAGAAVTAFLNKALERAAGENPQVQGWYAGFVREVALPNAQLFSYLVAYGELLVGIALIVGLVTNFAALMGIVMNLSYLFAGSISKNPQMLLAEAALVVAGTAAGYYSLDRYLMSYLHKRLSRAPTPGQSADGNRAITSNGTENRNKQMHS